MIVSIILSGGCGTRLWPLSRELYLKQLLPLVNDATLLHFINFYNTVKPHKGIDNMTPYEKLLEHFYGEKV